jgi:hypothetical protein
MPCQGLVSRARTHPPRRMSLDHLNSFRGIRMKTSCSHGTGPRIITARERSTSHCILIELYLDAAFGRLSHFLKVLRKSERGRAWSLVEVSDDNFAISLPIRLVSVAALLRHYSPLPHPLLRLFSHVPALAYSN